MIKNERQYRITKAQIESFREAIEELAQHRAKDVHPLILKAQSEALRSQLEDLQGETREYESLRAGKHKVLELHSFDELPNALIRARIAKGLTQKELAEKLGLKEQQIQRYEASEYASASFERIRQVIRALGIQIREDVVLDSTKSSAKAIAGVRRTS